MSGISEDVLTLNARWQPPVSNWNEAKVYLDQSWRQIRVSMDGGAFVGLSDLTHRAPPEADIGQCHKERIGRVLRNEGGRTSLAEPLPDADVPPAFDLGSILVALTNEVAKLRFELERVKTRVT